MMVCPECNSEEAREISGEVVCAGCGLVLEEQVVPADDHFGECYDTNIVGGMPVKPRNISIGYVYSREEKQYLYGKKDIELAINYLKLPGIIETESLRLWKSCVQGRICKGRNEEQVIAACIYLAGIIHEREIDVQKLLHCFPEQSKNAICQAAESINTILRLGLSLPGSMQDRITRHAQKLQCPEDITAEALNMLMSDGGAFNGRSAPAISLGILYFLNRKHGLGLTLIDMCRLEKVTLKSVSKICTLLEARHDGKD